MVSKKLKYLVFGSLLLIVGYNSVYFENLSEVKASAKSSKFDANAYAEELWKRDLIPSLSSAVELDSLYSLLKTDKEKAFQTYSNALGIGNIRYFLIRGEGKVIAINENTVSVLSKASDSDLPLTIATEFVYGNTVRDAVGTIKINDFENTMDLNLVSEYVNKRIREEVIPPFKAIVKKGDILHFVGAIELNKKYLNLKTIEVIPVKLKILNKPNP